VVSLPLFNGVLISVCVLAAADGSSRFGHVLTSLPKPGGGEYGKYYSLPALNDRRIGKLFLSDQKCLRCL
jgi:hypothetical protein